METQQPISHLFGSVPLYSDEHLELILSTLNESSALIFLINAVRFAHQKGIFNFA